MSSSFHRQHMAWEPAPSTALFPWQRLLDSGRPAAGQEQKRGLWVTRPVRGWGLRKPGFSEVETGPKWTGQGWLAVPWQGPWSGP